MDLSQFMRSERMRNLTGKNIIVKFEVRDILGRLTKKIGRDEYSFRYNETPGNRNGLVNIEPIFPSNRIPKDAKNYFLMKNEMEGKYGLEKIAK